MDTNELYRIGQAQRAAGDVVAAEQAFRAVLNVEPHHHLARLGLATLLGNQFRLPEAEVEYRHAIGADPRNGAVHHNLGAILSQMDRAEEALDMLTRAESLGLRTPVLHINRGRALSQLYRLDEAERAFMEAVKLDARNVDAQLMLAQLRYMRGDANFARDVIAAAANDSSDLRLQLLLADVLRRAGDLNGAEKLLRDVLRATGPQPRTRAMLASTLHEAGRLKEAEIEALEAAAAAPRDESVIETLVVLQLSLGRHNEAQPFIQVQRARQPAEQKWIAYEASAARLAGSDRYRELYDYDKLVKAFDIEAPRGWSSIAELNGALLQALNQRHPFAAHPLDQSLRNGSQTAHSLLADADPAIRAVLDAFAAPLEHYRRLVGNHPGHPFSVRNQGRTVLTGCWSVQLRREGFHLNHIHSNGWISSAYYVSVPDEVNDSAARSGWLKFGEPRMAVPGADPERMVQPKAGRLVLFPSYMWHGTNPIHGSVPRTTIAFDAVTDA
jgi:Tfp pilus assembly protein PilF